MRICSLPRCAWVNADLKVKTILVTGTDTGVGKTVLTALLLSHLRQTGTRAFAIKPFCSGGRADAELLHSLQDGDLTLDEINPFHFPEPLSPLVAARKCNRQIALTAALARILPQFKVQSSKFKVQSSTSPSPLNTRPSTLLIEGAGGLLSPLGEGFNFLDFILAFKPASSVQTFIVAPNRLGTINHTLLTAHRLRAAKIRRFKVVLMDAHRADASSRSNASVLAELLSPNPVESIPFLGSQASRPANIRVKSRRLAGLLAQISRPVRL